MSLTENIFSRIRAFNKLYGLPTPGTPTAHGLDERLPVFKKMLSDEVDEGDEIMLIIERNKEDDNTIANELEELTAMADWLGDVIVYCTSEATRLGIPIELVLQIIMDSNMSKLGADGQPIIVDGKIQKGPNYWKPEPKIYNLLQACYMKE